MWKFETVERLHILKIWKFESLNVWKFESLKVWIVRVRGFPALMGPSKGQIGPFKGSEGEYIGQFPQFSDFPSVEWPDFRRDGFVGVLVRRRWFRRNSCSSECLFVGILVRRRRFRRDGFAESEMVFTLFSRVMFAKIVNRIVVKKVRRMGFPTLEIDTGSATYAQAIQRPPAAICKMRLISPYCNHIQKCLE